jgi:hypothetical protein
MPSHFFSYDAVRTPEDHEFPVNNFLMRPVG